MLVAVTLGVGVGVSVFVGVGVGVAKMVSKTMNTEGLITISLYKAVLSKLSKSDVLRVADVAPVTEPAGMLIVLLTSIVSPVMTPNTCVNVTLKFSPKGLVILQL